MPDSTLEAALLEAYALAPSNEVVLETLEISHPSIPNSVYLVRNYDDFTATLEDGVTVVTFEKAAFQMALPPANPDGTQDMQLAIANIDRRISDFLNNILGNPSPIKITYRPYLASDPSTPQLNPPLVLSLTDVKIDVATASGRAVFANIPNMKFPSQYYTRARFPALGD